MAAIAMSTLLSDMISNERLQNALTELGVYTGLIDSVIGDKTRQAVDDLVDMPSLDDPELTIISFISTLEAPLGFCQMYGVMNLKPLPMMTLTQVLRLQRKMVSSGSASSAAGGLQIIRKTLKSLIDQLHLSGSEYFDENMQIFLGRELLNRRGFNEFLRGSYSVVEIGNSLAKEWASLPRLDSKHRGLSHYNNDGLNKSLVGANAFENILTNINRNHSGRYG